MLMGETNEDIRGGMGPAKKKTETGKEENSSSPRPCIA